MLNERRRGVFDGSVVINMGAAPGVWWASVPVLGVSRF